MVNKNSILIVVPVVNFDFCECRKGIPPHTDQDICHFDTSIFNLLENLHLMGGPSSQEVLSYLHSLEMKEAKK